MRSREGRLPSYQCNEYLSPKMNQSPGLLELSLDVMAYEVEQAENGDEALRLLKRSDSRVSLVLLDIMMPFKDGIETLREIRQFNKNLPVIMLPGVRRLLQSSRQ